MATDVEGLDHAGGDNFNCSAVISDLNTGFELPVEDVLIQICQPNNPNTALEP